jgi:hypothetical protein
MPIYDKKFMSAQYKVVTKIEVKEFKKLLDIFKKAKNTFPYRNKLVFLKSIKLDEAGKSLEYYDTKVAIAYLTGVNLINAGDKFPFISKFYNDPSLCINDYNYAVMMQSLIQEANKLLPYKSKYLYDIAGSWTNGRVIIMEKK